MNRSPAGDAVGQLSVGLGATALLLPAATARAFGVNPGLNPALPLLVRFVGIRNATMGAGLLAADSQESRTLALQLGLVVGMADLAATLLAARKKVLRPRALLVAAAVLGGIGALGIHALQTEGQSALEAVLPG